MYVYVHVCIHRHTHIDVCINIHTCVCVCVCTYTYIQVLNDPKMHADERKARAGQWRECKEALDNQQRDVLTKESCECLGLGRWERAAALSQALSCFA